MPGLAAVLLAVAAAPPHDAPVAVRFRTLTRATQWVPAAAIKLSFRTFHPQGMVRIGQNFYISAVEVREAPHKLTASDGSHDRTTGSGVGHLFKIGPDGRLLGDLILGEGAIYHPGGIDYDGRSIWVAVSEYRPNSRAIVYRVDPGAMTAMVAFRWADHIGGVVHDTEGKALIGINWGSRRVYRWPDGRVGAGASHRPNPAQYIDYQDCHYVGARQMLCAGVAEYPQVANSAPYALGGLELVDLKADRPIWQVPIALRSPTGRPMTQNPFWMERTATGLRAWFMPDDDTSTLYAFDAVTEEQP